MAVIAFHCPFFSKRESDNFPKPSENRFRTRENLSMTIYFSFNFVNDEKQNQNRDIQDIHCLWRFTVLNLTFVCCDDDGRDYYFFIHFIQRNTIWFIESLLPLGRKKNKQHRDNWIKWKSLENLCLWRFWDLSLIANFLLKCFFMFPPPSRHYSIYSPREFCCGMRRS